MGTLKNILLLNAITSGATGLALATMSDMFASLFEVNETGPFLGVGIFLIVYGIVVAWVGVQRPVNTTAVNLVIFADGAWTAASCLILVFNVFDISLLGKVLITAVALWVLLMAFLQYRGIRSTMPA